jgi:hypothetical protein
MQLKIGDIYAVGGGIKKPANVEIISTLIWSPELEHETNPKKFKNKN